MVGRRDPQLSFLDLGWRERIPQTHFAWQLEHFCRAIELSEVRFAPLFSDKGRPSVSPVITVRAIIYQLAKGLSDRELEAGSAFDDRVKLALGMHRDDDPLDDATLCMHRKRFLEHDQGWQLLQITLRQAAAVGLLDDNATQIIDSFLVEGAGATQDTITLIRKAIRLVLRAAAELALDGALREVLKRHDYDSAKKPKIDWTSEAAKNELVGELVRDARALIAAAESLAPPPGEAPQAWATFGDVVRLLKRVCEQDIEEDDHGGIRIRQGVAKDRIVSVTDPDMRHGRKTTAKKTDGYKTTIVVGGQGHNFIEGVDVSPANVADAQPVPELMDKQIKHGRKPERLMGDTAYGSGDARVAMAEREIEMFAKAPPDAGRKGFFGKDRFLVDLDAGSVTCPAGVTTFNHHTRRDAQKRPISIYQFEAETCAACPLHAACTTNPRGRTVRLHYREAVLQEARAVQRTEAFEETYATRSAVERNIAQLTHHGARRARYRGLAKTRFQELMCAVGHNIRQWARLKDEVAGPHPFAAAAS